MENVDPKIVCENGREIILLNVTTVFGAVRVEFHSLVHWPASTQQKSAGFKTRQPAKRRT